MLATLKFLHLELILLVLVLLYTSIQQLPYGSLITRQLNSRDEELVGTDEHQLLYSMFVNI